MMVRVLLFASVILLCGFLIAQQPTSEQRPPAAAQPAQAAKPQPEESSLTDDLLKIITTVDVIVVPTLVFDRDDNTVSGIRPEQFRLFDNDK
jgi:hypothetical protein